MLQILKFLCLAGWCVGTMSGLLAAEVVVPRVQVPSQLTAQGIPEFARHLHPESSSAPAWKFLGWHPVLREMLVLAPLRGVAQVHRLRAPGASLEAISKGTHAVADAQWQPQNGRYVVLSRDANGDEAFRLFRVDVTQSDAGTASIGLALTPAHMRVKEYAFQNDGNGLYYLMEQPDGLTTKEPGAGTARSWLIWIDPLRPESSRKLAEVKGGRFSSLRVTAQGDAVVQRTIGSRTQTLRIAWADGKAAAISQPHDEQESGADVDAELIWSTRAADDDFRQLMRVELDTGRSQTVGPRLGADVEAVAAPPVSDGRPLVLVVNEAGLSRLKTHSGVDGTGFLGIAPELPGGIVRNPKWHPQLPEVGFHLVWDRSPAQLYSWDWKSDTLVAWSRADEVKNPLPTKVLHWKSFDGLGITGLHTVPPRHFKGARPVYIDLHGGPSSQARPGYLSATLRALVEQVGVHLIRPNVRGSEGFGKQYLSLDNGRLRENATRDISSLLDYIATDPSMDPTKVVVAGGSYGGYLTLAVAAAESGRLAGSICRVGISNFVTFLENTQSYRRDNRRREYGDERDPVMRQFLTDISPLSRVQGMTRPMFIVHGKNDPRVPYSEAQRMAHALQSQGTTVWFLSAEDEGHSFTKPANRDYLHQATLEFVSRVITPAFPAGQASPIDPKLQPRE